MMRKEKMFGSGMFVFCSFYDNLDGSVFRLVFFFSCLCVGGGWKDFWKGWSVLKSCYVLFRLGWVE